MEGSHRHVFVTGRAGTGKSTLLEYFRAKTKKRVAVLAPTGVAALNVKGQTIHSFFGFKPDIILKNVGKVNPKKKNLFKKLDAIVIDEISMVRADLLDCVDKSLRLNGPNKRLPFGGVQMIFIGDLYQLPPVVAGTEKILFKGEYESPYFFDAKSFQNLPVEFIELEKIYRQSDNEFIEILNAVRNNSATDIHFEKINSRLDPDFRENEKDFYIYLTSTNRQAEEINEQKISQLKTKGAVFQGYILGEFDFKHCPAPLELKLKVGAQIMLLNNDSANRWVNGTVGRIENINQPMKKYSDPEKYLEKISATVKLSNGKKVEVAPYTWEVFNFFFDEQTETLETETVGSFTQLPMKLAWAVTIHKSQGKTFEKAIIDIGRGTFAHGQMYVALSRCRTLEGIVLKKPIAKKHILMDWRVVKFLTRFQYALSEKSCSLDEKIEIVKKAIAEKTPLEITYLKTDDTKSVRVIEPKLLGNMEYLGKTFLGLKAYCRQRRDERVFRLDRMLEIKPCENLRK